jgi:DNA-binding XRE family transcriptional regulator
VETGNWDKDGYIKRIQLMRRVLDMNQTEFAAFVGLAYKKWNHYENGYPISRETAFILKEKIYWFSSDWLWHGDTRALSGGIMDQLRAAEAAERKGRFKIGKSLPISKVQKTFGKRPKK